MERKRRPGASWEKSAETILPRGSPVRRRGWLVMTSTQGDIKEEEEGPGRLLHKRDDKLEWFRRREIGGKWPRGGPMYMKYSWPGNSGILWGVTLECSNEPAGPIEIKLGASFVIRTEGIVS